MRALITGITGQTGSYLAELLLTRGYDVHGIIRRSSTFSTERIECVFDRLTLHYGDVTEPARLSKIIADVEPDEVYNLAAQSHVRVSFDEPHYTYDVVATGALNVFDAVMRHAPKARVYQASSSEMFGSAPPSQDERTPFHPRSPYASAKVAAHILAQSYRARGLWVACGILFNNESERRGETFVTRKITRALGRMRVGTQGVLELGNIEALRDWGYAAEYADAIHRIVRHSDPDDFVIATGRSASVGEFLTSCLAWHGMLWDDRIRVDTPRLLRPTEVDHLRGDASKASRLLGWSPAVDLDGLVDRMCAHDWELAQREHAARTAIVERRAG